LKPESDARPIPASKFFVTDLVKFIPEAILSDTVSSLNAHTVGRCRLTADRPQVDPGLTALGCSA